MNLLAFAATNSRQSINRALVTIATDRAREAHLPDAQIVTLDLNDYDMPIYSPDREAETGIPKAAQALFDQIGRADAILVSFAEHNGASTAVWKNAFDWMSRIDQNVWQKKPLVFLAATPGPRAGAGVLASQEMIAPFFGGDLRGTLGIGAWGEAYDDGTKTLVRAEDRDALDDLLGKLALQPA